MEQGIDVDRLRTGDFTLHADGPGARLQGVSAAGWPYVWYRAAFEGNMNGQRQAVNAMATAYRLTQSDGSVADTLLALISP